MKAMNPFSELDFCRHKIKCMELQKKLIGSKYTDHTTKKASL